MTNSGFDPVKEPIIHRLPGLVMETFSLSALVVFLAEIGDKTQLLSLMLALRFRAPWLISLAILLATLLNHAIAVWFGSWVVAWISPDILQYLIAASFFAVAVWTLTPDKLDDKDGPMTGYGVFLTTLALFLWPKWAIRPRSRQCFWRLNILPRSW
ncbi:TMEM165/GDT1 family protein [Endozoicomonas sp. GU-1]|uniref:TMEM165/GDT1 family protein n=1 Tax=Endozoicomonas sp. GU-1 TaxID=3009078 RepID=UPI0022B4CA67|nr:TMEM165/GDT1 family protein [Endozoicomonas sp. GU-1]WBA86685.1 TMEM165/GDT1 family protein [Endozoicomonas sp. GU-1]